jgi:hypothetical protein
VSKPEQTTTTRWLQTAAGTWTVREYVEGCDKSYMLNTIYGANVGGTDKKW